MPRHIYTSKAFHDRYVNARDARGHGTPPRAEPVIFTVTPTDNHHHGEADTNPDDQVTPTLATTA